jgi:hypothetical protein
MLICVETPLQENGSLETPFVSRLAQEVGESLRKSANFHSVVMRSTMLPGTMEEMITLILERSSGKRAGRESGIAYFLREEALVSDTKLNISPAYLIRDLPLAVPACQRTSALCAISLACARAAREAVAAPVPAR